MTRIKKSKTNTTFFADIPKPQTVPDSELPPPKKPITKLNKKIRV